MAITVLKGKPWSQSGSFLIADDSLIDVKNDINNIVITNVKVNPKEGSELADITITAFADQPNLTRFHVFAAQFLEANTNRNVSSLDQNLPTQVQREAYLKPKECQVMNNRKLGEEYCYVLDRKSKTRYMGNTLEKPGVLLKRTFVRETETQKEDLASNEDFKGQQLRGDEDKRSYDQNSWSASGYNLGQQQFGYSSSQEPSAFLSFLANGSIAYTNLRLDQNGSLNIKDFPLQTIRLPPHCLPPISPQTSLLLSLLAHLQPFQPKISLRRLGVVMLCSQSIESSHNVTQGQSFRVKDLTSTDSQIIDSVSTIV